MHTFLTVAYKKGAQRSAKYIAYIIHWNSRENDRYHLHLYDKETKGKIMLLLDQRCITSPNTGSDLKSPCILNPQGILKVKAVSLAQCNFSK